MSLPGPFELALIFLVVLLLFGAKRLPEIGKSIGQGIKEFKKAIQGDSGKDSSDESN